MWLGKSKFVLDIHHNLVRMNNIISHFIMLSCVLNYKSDVLYLYMSWDLGGVCFLQKTYFEHLWLRIFIFIWHTNITLFLSLMFIDFVLCVQNLIIWFFLLWKTNNTLNFLLPSFHIDTRQTLCSLDVIGDDVTNTSRCVSSSQVEW